MDWTDERIAQLKQLWATGLSVSHIAEKLGGFEHCADGGRNAVLGKAHRLDLPKKQVARAPLVHKRTPPTRTNGSASAVRIIQRKPLGTVQDSSPSKRTTATSRIRALIDAPLQDADRKSPQGLGPAFDIDDRVAAQVLATMYHD